MNTRDEHGNTALHIAAANNYCDIIKILATFEYGHKN